MSTDDDIFLKTFNQMIDILKGIGTSIELLKKTVEVIQLSIDGLGTGLTSINNNIMELNSKVDSLTNTLSESKISTSQPSVVKQAEKAPVSKKTKTTPKTKEADAPEPSLTRPSTSQHPIFIDLLNKINESGTYKEVGESLIESLEQIESSFSFSRVFYEIRRIGNSLIRKGSTDFPPKDKLELTEKLLDWESRLVE
ncbi:MAG: hypothetical protein FK730_11630 [Asgard group archaeon]|nr:hypothetical protein [Asgard group archaeon]